MEFRDLGPLLVEADDLARAPGGARLSTVLAVLLSRVGEPVPATALVTAIWGEDPPPRSGKVLESHVWRLRKVLEPDRGPRAAATVLRTDPAGYLLDVDPERIDSVRLAGAAERSRAHVAAGRWTEVLAGGEPALACWRGPFCADVRDTGWLAPVRERLSDLRLELVEHRATALMELGQPERAVHELAPMVAEHPLRERLWALRILGLYRSGRQAAALELFERIRRILADELGVDPGPELARLHLQVLNHDDELLPSGPAAPATGTGVAVPADPVVEVHLPGRRSSLIGRDEDVVRVSELLGPGRLVTLIGFGGVGKTRLAVEVASTARAAFPDGVWFVDLAPLTDPDVVALAVADALGLTPTAETSPERLLTAAIGTRRMLLVLDNCEHVTAGAAALVDRLLDACPGVNVLATSREPLEVAGERSYSVAPLDVPAADGPAEALARSPSVRLFADRLASGTDAPTLEVTGPDGPVVRRICAAVGGLPLGIELAAARARVFALTEIADSLERFPAELSRSGPGPERHATLRQTVDWSYRLARADEQILHRRLAVLPGPFTVEAAAALCSVPPLRAEQALDLLGGLAHRSLVTAVGPPEPGRATTFTQLVPIRAHADLVLDGGERDAVVAARDGWVIDRVLAAPLPGAPGQPAHYDWLDDNRASVRAVLRSVLVDRPDPVGLELAWRLIIYWHDRERLLEFQRWAAVTQQVAAALPPGSLGQAVGQAILGSAEAVVHRTDAAAATLARAVPVLADPPAGATRDAARLLLVVATCAFGGDVVEWATTAATVAVDLAGRGQDRQTEMAARGILAACTLLTGDLDGAQTLAAAVLAENTAVDNGLAVLFAEVTRSIAAQFAGDGPAGLRHSDAVLHAQVRLGTRNFADSFESRGTHLLHAGELADAARAYAVSAAWSERQGRSWPWHPGTQERLAALRADLGEQDFQRSWASGLRMSQLDPAALAVSTIDGRADQRPSVRSSQS